MQKNTAQYFGKGYIRNTRNRLNDKYGADISTMPVQDACNFILCKSIGDTIIGMDIQERVKDFIYECISFNRVLEFDILTLCMMEAGREVYKNRKSVPVKDQHGYIYDREANDSFLPFAERDSKCTSGWCVEFRDISSDMYQIYQMLPQGNPFDTNHPDRERFSFGIAHSIYTQVKEKSIENRILFEQILGYALTQKFYTSIETMRPKYNYVREIIETREIRDDGEIVTEETEQIKMMRLFAEMPYLEFRLKLADIFLDDFPKQKPQEWESLLKVLSGKELKDDLMNIYKIDISQKWMDKPDDLLKILCDEVSTRYAETDLCAVSDSAKELYKKGFLTKAGKDYMPTIMEIYNEVTKKGEWLGTEEKLWEGIQLGYYGMLIYLWVDQKSKKNLLEDNLVSSTKMDSIRSEDDIYDRLHYFYKKVRQEQDEYFESVMKNNKTKIRYTSKAYMDYELTYAVIHSIIMDVSMSTIPIIQ